MSRQASRHPVFSDDPNPDDPLIGARLRFALNYVEQRILDALAAAGFDDIQLAHFKVLRFPPPEDERPIDLAHRAGTTKQAMNYLLVQLEEMGYVVRTTQPASTSRLVTLTPRGWEVARLQRATVRAVEAHWERKLGKERFSQFYSVLQDMTESGAQGHDPEPPAGS